jgi:hypothetical protein
MVANEVKVLAIVGTKMSSWHLLQQRLAFRELGKP